MTGERVLLVSLSDPDAPAGGRELLYRMNRAVLGDLIGDGLGVFTPPRRRSPLRSALTRGQVNGLDDDTLAALVARVEAERPTQLFLDGSNLGAAARAVKRRFPEIRLVTFFHNVESRFFLGALWARPGPRALAVLLANHLAERAAVRWSDCLLCLSERDSRILARVHGRGADALLPLAMTDQPGATAAPSSSRAAPFALFVGGGFYANVAGLRWYARSVAPRLPIPTVAVGRGLERLAGVGGPSLRLVGAVDDLACWYRGATFVVAPIRDGSGMKTKVAEALMHGKRVIGTPEAFSGYAADVVAAGWLVRSAGDFVRAAETALAAEPPAFDPALRALYERDHSFAAARARMARVIERR